ncbi:MAG: hypothetical protein HY059_22065 [Proteobacteria bacterium]|nr:hypothetical protein [Pseudomonadota bacterium]
MNAITQFAIAALVSTLPAAGWSAGLEGITSEASGALSAAQTAGALRLQDVKDHPWTGRPTPPPMAFDAFSGRPECRIVDLRLMRRQPTLMEALRDVTPCLNAVGRAYGARVSAEIGIVSSGVENLKGILVTLDPRSSGNAALVRNLNYALTKRGNLLFGHPAILRPAFESAAQAEGRKVVITNGDNGKTFRVRRGDQVIVELKHSPSMLPWHIETPEASILEIVPIRVKIPAGLSMRFFKAVAPGTLTLHAVGRPNCPPNRMCPKFLMSWSATVVVE